MEHSIHEVMSLKPYGVLGKQRSVKYNKDIQRGDDPANMDSCVIVDAVKLQSITKAPKDSQDLISQDIYKWLGVDTWSSFTDDVVRSVNQVIFF